MQKNEWQKNGKKYLQNHRISSQILSNDEFLKKFNEKNPYSNNIEIISKYKGALKKVTCICKRCGNKWKSTATSLISGSGCPKCVHSSTSFMEQCIKNTLKYVLDVEILSRDKSLIKKEIDIVVPKYKLCIEIGSWMWHQQVFDNDLQKKKMCEEKGYKLIIIYDRYDSKKINNPDIYTYNKDIGSEKNHTTIKSIIKMILDYINIEYKISEKEWKEIINKSYLESQRVSTEEFLEKLKLNNKNYNNIEILSSYTRAKGRIKCKCKICNNIWEVEANELLRGRGCKICNNKLVRIKSKKRKYY